MVRLQTLFIAVRRNGGGCNGDDTAHHSAVWWSAAGMLLRTRPGIKMLTRNGKTLWISA